MQEDRFRKLTERQRECLRLLLMGYEIKEIARELAITPIAVTERLRAARQALGVGSSREAARLLAANDGDEANIGHVDMPQTLAAPPTLAPFSTASEPMDRPMPTGIGVMEEAAIFAPIPVMEASQRVPWPLPTKERPRNDLRRREKVLASVALTFLLAVVLAISFSAFVLLTHLLTELAQHGG